MDLINDSFSYTWKSLGYFVAKVIFSDEALSQAARDVSLLSSSRSFLGSFISSPPRRGLIITKVMGGGGVHDAYNKPSWMSHCIIYISLSYIRLSGLITLSNN